MGCQIDMEETIPGDPESQIVYVNKVGTFGLSPAGDWWTRIAACGIRATHHLLGPGYPIDLLLYADDLEALRIGSEGRKGIPLLDILLSGPRLEDSGWLSAVEWLGMETEYSSYRLGMSRKRASWLSAWLNDKVTAARLQPRRCLGPLHAWSSAIQGNRSDDAEGPHEMASRQARHGREATTASDSLLRATTSELL